MSERKTYTADPADFDQSERDVTMILSDGRRVRFPNREPTEVELTEQQAQDLRSRGFEVTKGKSKKRTKRSASPTDTDNETPDDGVDQE